jgi:hypothetical protein
VDLSFIEHLPSLDIASSYLLTLNTMKQDTRTISFWNCGSLLPDDEINVLTGFLTCKVPDIVPATTTTTVIKDHSEREYQDQLSDPIYSIERSPTKQRASSPRPWATQAGTNEAPIDIQDASIDETAPAESTSQIQESREDSLPARVQLINDMIPEEDDNSITEDPVPRVPGPEVVTTTTNRRRLHVPERKASIRVTPEGPKKAAATMNHGTGIELRKVFENEEYVTFRKVPYSGKLKSIPFVKCDVEAEDDCHSRRSNNSHQVLVVTKKRYPR